MLSPLALLSLALAQAAPTSPPATPPANSSPAPPLAQPAPPTLPPEPAASEPAPAQPAPEAAPAPVVAPRPNEPYTPPAPERVRPEDVPRSITHRRFVFTNTYAINIGILYPTPSGELGLFLGSSLLPRKSGGGGDWNSAIGYQATLSLGGAENSTYEASPDARFVGERRFFHRHHLTLTGYGGARGRFYYSLGGGVWMWMSEFGGFEGQGRLGVRFAVREDSRVSGVFGGQFRLTGAVQGAPMPQFGLFLGFMLF